MDNKSILDQIISNHKAEEVSQVDAKETIDNLFGELSVRERDVLMRRFGLHGGSKETLENIGAAHKLTRERIRQIESSGLKKLRQLKELNEHIKNLKKVIIQLLEEHGGLMETEYLLNTLMHFSVDGIKSKKEEATTHRRYLDFIISKLLHEDFEHVGASQYFKNIYKLKYQAIEHIEAIIDDLIAKVSEEKKIYETDELINLLKDLESFQNNSANFDVPNNIDLSAVLTNQLFEEAPEIINNNKVLYSLMRSAKKLEQNKFGQWGLGSWREIKPKTINDKIYLIMKNHGNPMHFTEIADRINDIAFDRKKANAATVHNELILDDKYVLVGRGLYGLKEWGNKKGTVMDVIEDILQENEAASRDEIIKRVLEKRLVKKATIVLALMNKNKFEKTEDGKYKVKMADIVKSE
jgi:DNA-directed RNA polymerase delta subunit